jgi:hypothetical protein
MAKDPTCLVCEKVMELGFITSDSVLGVLLPRWHPGAQPAEPHLAGRPAPIDTKPNAGAAVVAYRCPQCGALRLYAHDAPKR